MTRWRTPVQAATAAALLVAGALLPWLTLYAGLQTLPGTTGPYGRLLLGAGALLLVVAVGARLRPDDRWRWLTGLIGAVALYPAARGIIGLREVTQFDELLVAAPGPGPWVALVGGLVAFTALFLGSASRPVNEVAPEQAPAGAGTRSE